MTHKTTYTLYRPGQPAVQGEAELDAEPGYQAIKALVEPLLDNQPLEHVSVLHNSRHADMFVDEVGALNGLPRNEEATAIYRAAALRRSPSTDPEAFNAIYGPAVVFDRRVWF